MQVASRLWVLWGIIDLVPERAASMSAVLLDAGGGLPRLQLNLGTLLTAWCLSEVIRYSFFAAKVRRPARHGFFHYFFPSESPFFPPLPG
jgi:very-long-chain (3R)-3-hydroxyacyl-CoA dehydratase